MPRAAFARNACMRIIDRYLFRQLAVPVVIAVGALTLVAMVLLVTPGL